MKKSKVNPWGEVRGDQVSQAEWERRIGLLDEAERNYGKRKKKEFVSPPTIPARPINGGRLEYAERLEWEPRFKLKLNGRRRLVNVRTERTWNRYLEEVNDKGFPAFHRLNLFIGMQWPQFEWLDCEFLHGRTSVGKDALIVLDVVNQDPWEKRQNDLANLFEDQIVRLGEKPAKDEIYYLPPIHGNDPLKTWLLLQEQNKEWGAEFYEGLVGYKTDAPYPMQLGTLKRDALTWIKYRFIK